MELEEELAVYIEDLALFFERSGLPRISGRILGLLLVCDPPHRSSTEIAQELGVSKASVSNMTRLLLSGGLIEPVGVPGERSTYYAIRSDGFEQTFEGRMGEIVGYRELIHRGLELIDSEDHERSRRLLTLSALYEFWSRELPLLLEKWREEREELIAKALEKKS